MAKLTFPGNVFPLGTHVYREPHQDQEELMADLPVLRRLGFNMLQECWSVDEPREGEVDLGRIEDRAPAKLAPERRPSSRAGRACAARATG
ncbi:MAG TPA: hypothetical protein VM223_21480 [Planctomycetota bacterium]|nr:hypothetical protein [Planctomycetota bacterium]